jgi:hypothetical protein
MTDSIYYLTKNDLHQIAASFIDYGVIATGTMHVGNRFASKNGIAAVEFDNDQQGRVIFYRHHKTGEHRMTMQVKGNTFAYDHPQVFPELLVHDSTIMTFEAQEEDEVVNDTEISFSLILSVLDSIDLGATLYKRFVITKVSNHDIDRFRRELSAPTMFPPKTQIPLDEVEEKKEPNTFDKEKFNYIPIKDTKDFVSGETLFKVIDSKIQAYTLTGIRDEQSILEKIRSIGTYIELKMARSTFAIDMETYNRITRQCLETKKIDRKFLVDSLLLIGKQLPSMKLINHAVPVLANAINDALMIESRVQVMLEGSDIANINKAKAGELRAKGGLMSTLIKAINKIFVKTLPGCSNVTIEGLEPNASDSTWYSGAVPNFQ